MELIDKEVQSILNLLKEEHFVGNVYGEFAFKHKEVLKGLKIAYLKGLLEYNIWADSIPMEMSYVIFMKKS